MMQLTISLDESYDVAAVLRDIAMQVENGLTSGIWPSWSLS